MFTGLYRFRTGDVLRVKRFKRNYPLFEFLRRKNVVLSVNLEKTDEPELQAVIDKAYGLLKGTSMEVVDYTSTVDLASLPGHYIIYWEMVNNG
jgi:auxin responsive GH3 family protein